MIDYLIKEGLLQNQGNGAVIYMDNRSVNFSGGTNKNINVNTGDGEIQQIVNSSESGSADLELLINKLVDDIKNLSPNDEIDDALDNADKIKSAIENGDQTRARKLFGWLPNAVQTATSAVELIAKINDIVPG